MSKTLFEKIAAHEIPAQIVFEDELVCAFRDINPAAPTHILVIPRHHGVTGPADLGETDADWVGRMLVVATRIAANEGLAESGYRLLFNNGEEPIALGSSRELLVTRNFPLRRRRLCGNEEPCNAGDQCDEEHDPSWRRNLPPNRCALEPP